MDRKGKMLRISGFVLAILGGLVIAGIGVIAGAKTIARNRSIDTDAAKVFCLADAQVTEDEISRLEIEFERQGMQYVYEVEFDTNDEHYNYVLNALDGTVLSRQPAQLPVKKLTEEPGISLESETIATEEEQTSRKYITVDQAKQTAVLNSGNTISGVYFSEAKLEEDDDGIKYEIEFYTDTMEFEYEIDPWSGMILSASSERLEPEPVSSGQDIQTHDSHQEPDSDREDDDRDDDDRDDDDRDDDEWDDDDHDDDEWNDDDHCRDDEDDDD